MTKRSTALRKPEPEAQPQQQDAPFAVTASSVQEFNTLRARLAALAAEMSQAAVDAAAVAATPEPRLTATVTALTRPKGDDMTTSTTGTAQTAVPQAPTPSSNNVPTFNDLLQVATDLGTQAGQGKDTQIKFDLKIIEAAYLGALDLDPNKHGTDRRDGVVLAEAYVKAQQGSVMFDAKSDKSRKLISNVDKCIKLGANPKWGQHQPLQNVNALITYRQQMRRDPAKAKKLDDAHNALMRYATAQLRSDMLIDGAARDAYAFKREVEERSVEDVLEGIRRQANNLKAGKVAHCPALDNSKEVQDIINACTKRLTAIAKARGTNGTP